MPIRRKLQQAYTAAVGASGEVRSLTPRIRPEVLHLYVCAAEAEVLEAVKNAAGETQTGEVRVSVFAPNARGERVAVVDLAEAASLKMLGRGKKRVSWINCRVRRRVVVTCCHRCLGYGHTRRECKGPDRSEDCWRCGDKGHSANSGTGAPKFRLCAERGNDYPSNHVQGSGACCTFRDILSEKKGQL